MRFSPLILLGIMVSACGGNVYKITDDGSVDIKPASFVMGSDAAYPEEGPSKTVSIGAFNVDATEVTNAQFAKFVKDTGYVTDAERPQPGFEVTGGAVFRIPTTEYPQGWQFVEGANWQHPEGPSSSINGKDNNPVVQISLNDARAYAKWAGRRLPTEPEWEYAAKGGSDGEFVWGDEVAPGGQEQANRWQGMFPYENTAIDGFEFRAPARSFPANGFGLYDMIGNVWEWTDTPFQTSNGEPIHVIKGGSFLCAENYCRRYRASARQPQEAGLSTNHIGFRTVADIEK